MLEAGASAPRYRRTPINRAGRFGAGASELLRSNTESAVRNPEIVDQRPYSMSINKATPAALKTLLRLVCAQRADRAEVHGMTSSPGHCCRQRAVFLVHVARCEQGIRAIRSANRSVKP